MQQRPGDTQIGLEPKALKLLRSTKAGALAPATLDANSVFQAGLFPAQRRPER